MSSICLYSLDTYNEYRLGQRHGLQTLALTLCFYKNIYQKMAYIYFYESNFQDKSIYIVFKSLNSTA